MNSILNIENGLCHCGCGQKTQIATSNDPRVGWIKGQPRKFVHGHNMRSNENAHLHAEEKCKHSCGYIWKRCENHPRQHNGYVLEHILVAEQTLGRLLRPEERVHHENEIKSDNRPENLTVFANEREHKQHHVRMKALKACGNPDWRACKFCHNYDAPENLIFKYGIYHIECRRIHDRAYKLTRRN